MKKIITVIVLCLALASCAKENSGGTEPSTQDVSTSAAQETEVLSDFETETETEIEKRSTAEVNATPTAADPQETKVTQKSVKSTQEERKTRTETTPKTTAVPEPTVVKRGLNARCSSCAINNVARTENPILLLTILCVKMLR